MAGPVFQSLWYDSWWLQTYVQVKDYLQAEEAGKLASFEKLIAPLHTNPDFETKEIKPLLNNDKLSEIQSVVSKLTFDDLNASEFFSFGRHLVRNADYFNQLQLELMPIVEEQVGEALEPCYNFLSLYNNFGSCPAHMDSPEAKWTLDICIDQSDTWPILFSDVVDWPTELAMSGSIEELERIEHDNAFKSFEMKPGEAIIFSGSSQWHYRDAIPKTGSDNFCHLVFLHYIPKGCGIACDPNKWGAFLGSENVDRIVKSIRSQVETQNERLVA